MSSSISSYTLRFILSGSEYSVLYDRLLSKYKFASRLPDPSSVQANEAAESSATSFVHGQTRLLVKSYVIASLANIAVLNRSGRGVDAARLSATLSGISAIYRVIYYSLNTTSHKALSAEPDRRARKKLRKLSKVLVPLISGAAAGSALSIIPSSEGRSYAALYLATRALETIYNYLDDLGYVAFKPRVLGSWSMFPFAFSQLFYAFIFHPDCCPDAFKRIMLSLATPFYIPPRPEGYPLGSSWPEPMDIVQGVATVSEKGYPKFVSQLMQLKPVATDAALASVSPVLNMAHPGNSTLTGAITHPLNPSELQTFLDMLGSNYSSVSKYLLPSYGALAIVQGRRDSKAQGYSKWLGECSRAVAHTFRTATFISMTSATAWGGIALFQNLLPATVLPVYRYRLIGLFSGLWAFVDQVSGRTRYLYAVRLAIISQWKILVKQKKVKPIKNGDVLIFALSFAAIMAVFDLDPGSVSGSSLRKALNWLRSTEYRDPVISQNSTESPSSAHT